ncbi:sensor histidine kinase [Agrobacterium sp. ES01]|uniref:sensor histidine kinase n=1 Tax=Agrobacterium sp. ES01 TaxID=3420714 RepID=UPI003D0EA070
MNRLTWVEPGGIDALAGDFFIHALIDMGACYILYDQQERCICITRLPARWSKHFDHEPSDDIIFGDDIAGKLHALRSGLQQVGDQSKIELSDDGENTFEFRCRKVDIPDGGLHYILSVTDKSEERQREKVLRALLLEVSHRSKNLLAVVQGIASQTARFSGSLESFLQKFRGRLYALSQSQDLVTDSSWRGAAFRDLLDSQLSRFLSDNPSAIVVTGENLLLSPNASMHVGLALHELIVNAISHGDIIKASGLVQVSCETVDTEEGKNIRIIWNETSSRKDGSDFEAGNGRFGSTVLERVVPASVNGSAVHRCDDKGVYYELVFPADLRA